MERAVGDHLPDEPAPLYAGTDGGPVGEEGEDAHRAAADAVVQRAGDERRGSAGDVPLHPRPRSGRRARARLPAARAGAEGSGGQVPVAAEVGALSANIL